jgi:triosephosphate isomerase
MKKLIAGNWKMNTTRTEGLALAKTLAERTGAGSDKFEMIVCPPAVWIEAVANTAKGSALAVGGQDAHTADKGAFTGNIAAPMLKELGCKYVILGHSERRQFHAETNDLVRTKAENAIKNGLIPIICVGEVEAERVSGKQDEVVGKQLAESLPASGAYVIAYEPVWAIGTGKTATADDVKNMHAFIRKSLAGRVDQPASVAILYGGSVKAANAAEILHTLNVDGVLVGGASLQADEFWAIAQAA